MSKLVGLLNRSAIWATNSGKDFVSYLKSPRGQGVLRELAPPTPAELPRAIRDGISLFKNRGRWREVPVREAWLNALVTTEVICWFFVGECIGKGNLIGYQV